MSWSPHDTARFVVPVAMYRCDHGANRLIQGIAGGTGVLIWTRPGPGDSAGSYPLLTRGDSVTPRGAMVSVRFMIGDIARGMTLDSGAVTLVPAGGRMGVRVQGSGLDYSAGQRMALEAWVASVPLAPASANCQVKL